MKFYFSLLAITLLVGCTGTEFQEQPTAVSEICVSATAISTKTSITGTTISWMPGDNIGMYIGDLHSNIKLSNTKYSPSNFAGLISAKGQTHESVNYYAYYPYTENVSGNTVSATLPTSQVAPFDATANYMVANVVSAKYDENDMPVIPLAFNTQLFSIVKITVTNSDESYKDEALESIELVSTDGKRMAGAFSFDVTSPFATLAWSEGVIKVTKVSSDFSIPVTLGLNNEHSVYLFVRPDTYSGLKVGVRTGSGYVTVATDESVVLESGNVTSLPIIDYAAMGQMKPVQKIACWGDSYTHGTYAYPPFLQDFLGNEWKVYDGGHNGERTTEIVARQGGFKLFVDSSFTLPASGTVAIDGIAIEQNELTTADVNGTFRKNRFMTDGTRLFNTCLISDVECNLTRNGLIRVKPGEEMYISEGTEIISYGARNCRDALNVILIGVNGGWNNDFNLLIRQHWAMIKYATNKKYIVLTIHSWKDDDYDDSFNRAFGSEAAIYCPEAFDGLNHVVHLREAVVDRGVELLVKTGVYASAEEVTDSDRSRLADGYWPYSFLTSTADNHPNHYGEIAIAILIHDKMVKLGYLSDSYLLNDVANL